MASIRLLVDPSKPHGKMLLEAVDHLYDAQTLINRVKGAMDMAYRASTPAVDADYAPVAAELGMPFGTGTEMQAVKDLVFLVGSAQGKLNDAVLQDFMKKLDQG